MLLLCAGVNLPFGRWRSRQEKFSFLWWLFIHAPVPLIIALRVYLHVHWAFIPLCVAMAALGQYLGGKRGKNRE
ncbi:MAG: hypothetical protein LBR08_10855 [Bacteroidales bacterium]|nr:hypothetical protein [Bacteroidales bacterium]